MADVGTNFDITGAAGNPGGLKTIGSTRTQSYVVNPYLTLGPVGFGRPELLRDPPDEMSSARDPASDFTNVASGGRTAHEAPEEIRFGITQKLVTHDLIGGTRVAQSLGYTFKDVTWSGKLYGDILPRARTLQNMAAEGREQRLSFLDERYDVIVLDFEVTYKHRFFYEYNITVKPIRDVSGRFKKGAKAPSNVDKTALAQLTRARETLAKLTAANAAASALQISLDTISKALAAISPIATALGIGAVGDVVTALQVGIAAGQTYSQNTGKSFGNAHAVAAATYIDSLTVLLSNVKRGQSPATVQVVGGYLPQVAAQFYGDASLAEQLRQANGLHGYRLPPDRLTTLSLPPLAATGA